MAASFPKVSVPTPQLPGEHDCRDCRYHVWDGWKEYCFRYMPPLLLEKHEPCADFRLSEPARMRYA